MFSFTSDTVLEAFCGSGATMVAAFRTGRNSIGVDIEPEYCRMAARYLKAENTDLFAPARLVFEKAAVTENVCVLAEEHAAYFVRPARKRLE
jgi:site-specific DNA-methyltransferase (adenine-specific)